MTFYTLNVFLPSSFDIPKQTKIQDHNDKKPTETAADNIEVLSSPPNSLVKIALL